MSTQTAPIYKVCYFESPFGTVQPYFCYTNEVCCKGGCCIPYDLTYLKSWHFWYKILIVVGIIFFFVFYRYMFWYCKRKNGNGHLNEENNNHHIVNLMVTYNNEQNVHDLPKYNKDDPPPKYNVAINLPKPENVLKATTQDEVPTYEQAIAQNH